ncbi:hypothetical protein [Comamonas flocculans]|uniref:hypothetical protein n=1 Tax=Comamonas flocculans TaxID=2597701 RepID=UPI0016459081|nr:hypothetical protein [Comamonas flocculans]
MQYSVRTLLRRPLPLSAALGLALLASGCAVPVNDGYGYGYGYDPYGGYATPYPSTVYDAGPTVVYGSTPSVMFGSQIWLSSSERRDNRWQRDGWRDRDGHSSGRRGPDRGQRGHEAGRNDRGHADRGHVRPAPQRPTWRPEPRQDRQDRQEGHRGDGPRAPGSIMREMP